MASICARRTKGTSVWGMLRLLYLGMADGNYIKGWGYVNGRTNLDRNW